MWHKEYRQSNSKSFLTTYNCIKISYYVYKSNCSIYNTGVSLGVAQFEMWVNKCNKYVNKLFKGIVFIQMNDYSPLDS